MGAHPDPSLPAVRGEPASVLPAPRPAGNGAPSPRRGDEPRASSASSAGFDLFRVFGVQIAIDPSWIVVFGIVLWSLAVGYFPVTFPGLGRFAYAAIGLIATLAFFASVLLHELGHAAVANRLGQGVRRITLFVFGGVATLEREADVPRTELLVAAVGPLTSIALAALFWLVAALLDALGAPPSWVGVPSYLARVNLVLGLFNLLPGLPLDGGRLLRALVWYRTGDVQVATARAAAWGRGVAICLMLVGALHVMAGAIGTGVWLLLIGAFLRGAAAAEYAGFVATRALAGVAVRDVMAAPPVVVDGEDTVAHAIEAAFLRHGYGGFPVVHDGRVTGLLSLADVQRCPPAERAGRRVREVMRAAGPALRIAPSADLSGALRRMADAETGRLLVVDGKRLVGIVTRSGITRLAELKTRLAAA